MQTVIKYRDLCCDFRFLSKYNIRYVQVVLIPVGHFDSNTRGEHYKTSSVILIGYWSHSEYVEIVF